MGTNVYLEWDSMTEQDRHKQHTGFSIFFGHLGYLRASIWMDDENQILRRIFPDEYWYDATSIRYRFTDKGLENVMRLVDEYLETEGLVEREKPLWAKSLVSFYQLGLKLDKEGKNPRVLISW